MNDKVQAMVLASFIGDSLALAAHWIYDTEKIAREFGRVESFITPKPDSYHPTKRKGQFTHYGDQALCPPPVARCPEDIRPGGLRGALAEALRRVHRVLRQGNERNAPELRRRPRGRRRPPHSPTTWRARRGSRPLVFCLRRTIPRRSPPLPGTQTAMTHGDPLTKDSPAGSLPGTACRILARGCDHNCPCRRGGESGSPERRLPAG